ncbi:MAG: SGNH/GDSL hydrolase family protein [Planctomycetota bacterium]
MSRSRRRARVIAAILSPLVFLGLVEGILRIAGYRYVPYSDERKEEDVHLPPIAFARHPDLLWTLPPDTTVDKPAHGYPAVKTNRLGLRGELPPAERRPGEVRVLCLGDSITFGLGHGDAATWPSRLKAILSRRPEFAGRPVTVVNGAVPGWSSVQGMRLLDQLDWLASDVVVFWFGMNDVQEAWGRPDSRKGGSPGALDDAVALLSGLRTVQLMARISDAVRGGGEETRATVEEYAAAVERLRAAEADGGPKVVVVASPERMAETEAQLASVVARMEEEGVRWVVGPRALLMPITPARISLPIGGRVVPGPSGRELMLGGRDRARCDLEQVRKDLATVRAWREGLERRWLAVAGDMLGAEELFGDAPGGAVYTDNCHLTAEGCDRAAAAIAARIEKLLDE